MENAAPKDQCPSLLELTRTTLPNDSSSHHLPEIAASDFLSHGNFFFLGGAPFIYRMSEGETDVFKDANGNPEIRFVSNVSENTGYFPHSVFQFTNSKVTIDYGLPLGSYDYGPQHIRGIGSLIHTFDREVPAFFITEKGLVPCRVVSIAIKLVPENLGCVSDQPLITFGCAKVIDYSEILGIYIPLGSTPQMSPHVTRPANNVWTVDLNSDNVADLAMVSGTTEGISQEFIVECIWFININGEWKIIDAAQELDCT